MMDAKLAALGLGWITSTIGIVFWVLVIGLLFVIVRFIRRKDYLLASVTCVPLAALFVLPVMSYMEQREYLAKYEPAKAIFDKLCKEQSAPIIKRTVEDVEGVLLLKVRPTSLPNRHQKLADQLWADAALPKEADGDEYIQQFLADRGLVERSAPGLAPVWRIVHEIGGSYSRGFRYVDVPNAGGTRTRITGIVDDAVSKNDIGRIRLQRSPTSAPAPQFAIDYENNVEPQLRKHWIAGTIVKVIDTKTGEVIAQQSYWNWDEGFGNTSQRSPWTTNRSRCPQPAVGFGSQIQEFVKEVIQTKQGG